MVPQITKQVRRDHFLLQIEYISGFTRAATCIFIFPGNVFKSSDNT